MVNSHKSVQPQGLDREALTDAALTSSCLSSLPDNDSTDADLDWAFVTSRMQTGDAGALEQFYRAMFPTMFAEAKRCSGLDEATCLDLVQDSMLKAIKSIKPMESQSRVESWSRIVVKSVTWDWFRKQKRLRDRLNDKVVLEGTFIESANIDNDEIDARLIWLEDELKTLPTDLRSMISLRFRLGWSLKEIGAKFGLKTGAVDGRIRRAVEQLKQKASREYQP